MKYLLLAIVFTSLSALACPELTGDYPNCFSSATGHQIGMSKVKVTQEVKNNVNVYKVSYMEINDDGPDTEATDIYVANKQPIVTETNGEYVIQTTSWCEEKKLKIAEEMMLGDATIAYAEGEISKFENHLDMDYVVFDETGEPYNVSITCK